MIRDYVMIENLKKFESEDAERSPRHKKKTKTINEGCKKHKHAYVPIVTEINLDKYTVGGHGKTGYKIEKKCEHCNKVKELSFKEEKMYWKKGSINFFYATAEAAQAAIDANSTKGDK